jgi:signal recognition particle subunit SRP54
MFDDLVRKFDGVLRKLRGTGKLTEQNIEESCREIRRVLLEADVHYKVAAEFIASVKSKALGREVTAGISPGQMLVKIVHDEMTALLGTVNVPMRLDGPLPAVVLVIGLQGSGKTTFCAKLGRYLAKRNRRALLAAADIHRPAAAEQLKRLAEDAGLPVFAHADLPADRIAAEAVSKARKLNLDTVIVDTAGRLHVDAAMMEEIAAVKAVVKPSEILFVADGMTGQDAVKSAQAFAEKPGFDGIVLTKMDGDGRGGAALSIRAVTGKPVKFLSTGEKTDALEAFHPDRLASRILGMGDIVSLVERAQEGVDREQAEKLAKRLGGSGFTLEDFLDQLRQVRKMGPLSQLMDLVPGMKGRMPVNAAPDEKSLVRVEAIIQSMTVQERRKPQLIDGSRRKRIASGSGTRVQDVNQVLRDFQTMQTLMKRMGKLRGKGLAGMPGRLPFG